MDIILILWTLKKVKIKKPLFRDSLIGIKIIHYEESENRALETLGFFKSLTFRITDPKSRKCFDLGLFMP